MSSVRNSDPLGYSFEALKRVVGRLVVVEKRKHGRATARHRDAERPASVEGFLGGINLRIPAERHSFQVIAQMNRRIKGPLFQNEVFKFFFTLCQS